MPVDGPALGFNEFMLVDDILPKDDLFGLYFEMGCDIFVHPQWYHCWRRDWPDLSANASTRRMFVAPTNASGCCGPQGKLSCKCGQLIGSVMADCIGPQWIVFFSKTIDRTDQIDGPWEICDDASVASRWMMHCGDMLDNLKIGEWESWLMTPELVTIEKRTKSRERLLVDDEVLHRKLVRVSTWSKGTKVGEVAG